MYTIHNKLMTITISPLGAEIQSAMDCQGREWIWEGDPEIWGRHAPICFPFVGRLRDTTYRYQGEDYQIPTHGFARDLPFLCTNQSATAITFLLESDEERKAQYPFDFSLEITYSLKGQILEKSHKITNKGEGDMWYELGGHDAFAMGFTKDEDFRRCALEIPAVTELNSYLSDEKGILTPKKKEIPLSENKFSLDHSKDGFDSYVLENLPQRGVSLLDQEGKVRLRLVFPDFDHLVLWSGKPDRFFCIEPWTSLPDCTFVGRGLVEKHNIRKLPQGKSEVLVYGTEFVI
ncbi:MAG: aldose 1-epimerase family protein [Eubacteriales bacterium]